MQNKPNLLNAQMNISFSLTKYYEKQRLCRRRKKQTQSNPNKLEANLSLRQRRKKGSGVRQKEVNGNVIYIGRFDDEKAAAMAYDARARELFGDYAAPNLPSSKERGQNKAERVAG